VRSGTLSVITFITIAIALEPRLSAQHAVRRPIDGRPNALIDLRTVDGVRTVKGQWRYSDTTIIETDFNAAGPDLKPSGKPIKTYDYLPKAGSIDRKAVLQLVSHEHHDSRASWHVRNGRFHGGLRDRGR
jgi:hypothetical protein